jgi:hypothetical protein
LYRSYIVAVRDIAHCLELIIPCSLYSGPITAALGRTKRTQAAQVTRPKDSSVIAHRVYCKMSSGGGHEK